MWMLMSLSLVMVVLLLANDALFHSAAKSLCSHLKMDETQNTETEREKEREKKSREEENTVKWSVEAQKGRPYVPCTLHSFALAFGCHFVLCLRAAAFVISLFMFIPWSPHSRFLFYFVFFCSLFCFIFFRIIIWMATNTIKATLIFSVNIFGNRKKMFLLVFRAIFFYLVWFCVHSQSLCVLSSGF